MSQPPANSEEEYYMDEPFGDELQSELDEEQEQYEEEICEDGSDSQTDTDVEAEYLRGNPHARRQQIYGKRAIGDIFARQHKKKYESSSSDDEEHVVVSKTVAEVNRSNMQVELTDDDTISARTLMPGSAKQKNQVMANGDGVSDNESIEVEDEMEGDLGEEAEEEEEDEIEYGNEYDDVKKHYVAQIEEEEEEEEEEDDEQEEDDQYYPEENVRKSSQDLVNIGNFNDSEIDSSLPTDQDLEEEFAMPYNPEAAKPQKKKRGHHYHPNLARQPVVDTSAPVEPKMEVIFDENGDNVFKMDEESLIPSDQLNVKFLEQQMTQMSEMIMKTFRLSGGAADSNALEQLALATKLMKTQNKEKSPEPSEVGINEEEEEEETASEFLPSASNNSDIVARRSCRCPSSTDLPVVSQTQFMMDECGQGDGLLRYPHLKQPLSARIPSVTSASGRSDNSGYRFDIKRPRSAASSEVNYKNVGRKSFSFTNPQVREIERQNNILLKKMMNVKPTINPTANVIKSNPAKAKPAAPRTTSAAVNRKKYQRQIDLDNDILKRKLEAVGSRRPIFK